MNADQTHEAFLREVIEQVAQNNRQTKPGTPMAELQAAIESAIDSLPPLEFEEFNQSLGDENAAEQLIRRAPEMIGWDADQIVEWVEELIRVEIVARALLSPLLVGKMPSFTADAIPTRRKPRLFGGS